MLSAVEFHAFGGNLTINTEVRSLTWLGFGLDRGLCGCGDFRYDLGRAFGGSGGGAIEEIPKI